MSGRHGTDLLFIKSRPAASKGSPMEAPTTLLWDLPWTLEGPDACYGVYRGAVSDEKD